MPMSDTELDRLAERAADRAVKKITEEAYREVGKRTLRGMTYIAGVLTVAAVIWLSNHGYFKLP